MDLTDRTKALKMQSLLINNENHSLSLRWSKLYLHNLISQEGEEINAYK